MVNKAALYILIVVKLSKKLLTTIIASLSYYIKITHAAISERIRI